MSLLLISLILLTNIILGIGIFLRNPRASTNLYYAAFVAALSVWMTANYLENEPGLVGVANIPLLLKLDFFTAPILFYFLFLFAASFAEYKTLFLGHYLVRTFLFIATLIAAVSPYAGTLLLKDISFYDNVVHFTSGPLFVYYDILIIGYVIASPVLLFLGRRQMIREGNIFKKSQTNYILFGAAISLGIAVIVNLMQAYHPIDLEISRLGLYGMIFLVVFTGYAIARHQFLDIKPTIMRLVSFTVFLTLFASVYTLVFILGFGKVLHVAVPVPVSVGLFGITVLVMLSFQPLLSVIKRLTDKLFFKGYYDSDKLMETLTHSMVETIDLNVLVNQLLKTILEEMRIGKGAFLFVKEGEIVDIQGIGYKGKSYLSPQFEALFHAHAKEGTVFLFENLTEGTTKKLFRKLDISIAIPIWVKKEGLAILILGQKLSGEIYFDRDIRTLELFASEAGIAIQNAESYSKIKQFNEELEAKVTERTKELKESQMQEIAKAKEVAKLKDEFVFLAAHELRAPVTAIRGFVNLTKDSQENFPKELKENLASITEASEHLHNLVDDILEIARDEGGASVANIKSEIFRPILDEVLHEVAPLIRQKNIALTIDEKLTAPVICDRMKLKEVIMNLVDNAIKYNKENGTIHIGIYGEPKKSQMIFQIADTGYGIPKEEQGKIFQKFFRATSPDTQDILGTGLGLFITKMLIQKMGGTLVFSSVEHEGTTFSFTLPLEVKG